MKQEDHLHLALSRYSISRKATLNVCIVCMCVPMCACVCMCVCMCACMLCVYICVNGDKKTTYRSQFFLYGSLGSNSGLAASIFTS